MGRPPTQVTPDIGRELCLRTGSNALLGGTLACPAATCSNSLLSAAAAVIPWSKGQSEASSKKDVLKALSRASFGLRTRLGESSVGANAFKMPIEMRRFRLEALKNYSIGIALRREQGDTPTIPYLKRATESTLTSLCRMPSSQPSIAISENRPCFEYASKAYQLRDRVNEREKLKIAGLYFLRPETLTRRSRTTSYGNKVSSRFRALQQPREWLRCYGAIGEIPREIISERCS